MEKLHENPFIVHKLERIVKEDYPFLEYDDHRSKKLPEDCLERVRNDELYVQVKPKIEQTERNGRVIEDICDIVDFTIDFTFSLSTDKVFYSFEVATRRPLLQNVRGAMNCSSYIL